MARRQQHEQQQQQMGLLKHNVLMGDDEQFFLSKNDSKHNNNKQEKTSNGHSARSNDTFEGGHHPQQKHTRIIGGNVVSDRSQYPYFVDLGGCGGSLIAPRVVLTAAHCGFFIGQEVRVGAIDAEWNENDGSAIAVVVDQIYNPSYNDWTLENDFTLLLLEESVASRVAPTGGSILELPTDDGAGITEGEYVHILGLGVDDYDSYTIPDQLHDASVQVLSDVDCVNAYGPRNVDTNSMFCAGIPTTWDVDSCSGDSGGPLVYIADHKHVLLGLTSWGRGCAKPDFPGVYARVPSAIDWIKQSVCLDWAQKSASFCEGVSHAETEMASAAPSSRQPLVTSCVDPAEQLVVFLFTTDTYPSESSWQIYDTSTGQVAMESASYYEENHTYMDTMCLRTITECYVLTIHDTAKDGLFSSGLYELFVEGDLVLSSNDLPFFRGTWQNHKINCL